MTVSPVRAVTLCTYADDSGAPIFPDMSPAGGIVCGVHAIVTGGQADDELTLVDINGLVGNDQSCEVLQVKDTMIAMNDIPTGASDTPTGETTAMVSMFQADCTAFRGVRHFGVKPVRANCVHVLTAISW